MTDYRVLDLFAGLGGFSSAFADSERWRVTTVDIVERFDPDIQADVFDLRPSDFSGRAFDVVLCGMPCTDFSLAASRYEKIVDGEPRTDSAQESVALVYHALGLIRGLNPSFWFLENPKGYLRHVIGEPSATVTWCQYGDERMKPTDLWGDHPPMTYRRCRTGDGCHVSNTDQEHGGEGNTDWANRTWGRMRDPAERAKVPYELSEAIRDACEAALDGEVAEQATLEEVTA